MLTRNAVLTTVGVIAAAVVVPAGAQTARGGLSTNVAAASAAANQMGEIVVTATKRAENLQDVPITMSAFRGDTLATLGIKSTVDLPQLTPGLGFQRTQAGVNTFLRGVGSTTAGYSSEAPVATYIDGLYLPNSAASAFSFNNIQRIEVLRGPQGTLYGRNTTGGLIHVITKEPGDFASVDASVGYATFHTATANFYGSTPLTDTLAANVAATYTNQGNGWGQNVFLGTDAYKFRDVGFQSKLRWQPSTATTITLRGFYDKVKSDQGVSLGIYPGTTANDGSPYLGEFRTASRTPSFIQQRQYNLSVKAEQDLGFATLTSITGYINNRAVGSNTSITGTLIPAQAAGTLETLQTAKTSSEELQLASNPSPSSLKWITGFFYYHDDTGLHAGQYANCIGATCNPAIVPNLINGYANTRSSSVFGEGTYSLTPATKLTLGLRYTQDKKSLTGLAEPLAGRPNSVATLPATTVLHPGDPYPGNPAGIVTSVTYGKITTKAVLAQDLSRDVHAYVSYNRGFKSGGYNPIGFTNQPSKPEVLDAYEAGVKSEWLDRKLRLNVSAFVYHYRDIQLRSFVPDAGPINTILLYNAASSHTKGIDVDFVLAPVKGLTINGGFEYLDAKYVSFPTGVCSTPRVVTAAVLGGNVSATCDLSGKRPPLAPRFSSSLGATYTFDTQAGAFALTANDGYKSTFFWEPDNRLKENSYHLINASLTWTANDPRYSAQLFVRNLTDKYYFNAAVAGGFDTYTPGAPRTYGASLTYRY